jgi:hypothetical protein
MAEKGQGQLGIITALITGLAFAIFLPFLFNIIGQFFGLRPVKVDIAVNQTGTTFTKQLTNIPNFATAWVLVFYKIKNEGTSPVDVVVKYGLGLDSPDASVVDIVERISLDAGEQHVFGFSHLAFNTGNLNNKYVKLDFGVSVRVIEAYIYITSA